MTSHVPAPGHPVPTGTYRLQLRPPADGHPGCTFADAARLVPYLARLGVSHVYCSPYLQAAPGSAHGYDVVDHRRLNEELGGQEAFDGFVAVARDNGLGLVLDVVPNHMAVSEPESQNVPWWDVLTGGRDSAYASWFDVAWDSEDNPGRVLLPVLGQPLADCLAAGEIAYDASGPLLRYYDHVMPVAPGTEKLRDDLPALLDAQHYRLCHWRVAAEELNYRRFFDVTTLAGIRVEDPAVFDATHELILGQVRDGVLDGLRIDHPDGLADPAGYLERLADATGDRWVVVEKILEASEQERLPGAWRCAGTTGYDVLNRVTGILVDPAGERPLSDLYGALTGEPVDFGEVVDVSKRLVLATVLSAEVGRLAESLLAAVRLHRPGTDVTRRGVREALVEVLAAFPVYRAYVELGEAVSEQALTVLREATGHAAARAPHREGEIGLVHDAALGRLGRSAPADDVVVRFQQTCGPVMAKGVEDTAFYRYHRLVALNEVGGDPGRFGTSVEELHVAAVEAQRDWPVAMTTLSTHDTKRSEDVRARLAVLAEVPGRWGEAVSAWSARHEHLRHGVLDRNIAYLAYQTILGAWPLPAERALAYLEKASREAKQHTTWTEPNSSYDETLVRFVQGLYADDRFLAEIATLVDSVVGPAGRSNALTQKLVQLTLPGVPDVYQGTELEDLSLVDPDNRRPVDWDRRRALLEQADSDPLPADAPADLVRLRIVTRALRLRRAHSEWFGAESSYDPLIARGDTAGHLVGFARAGAVVTLGTRLPVGLAADWGDTTVALPGAGEWVDVLSGHLVRVGADTTVPVGDLLARLPVALLVRD